MEASSLAQEPRSLIRRERLGTLEKTPHEPIQPALGRFSERDHPASGFHAGILDPFCNYSKFSEKGNSSCSGGLFFSYLTPRGFEARAAQLAQRGTVEALGIAGRVLHE